MTQQRKIEGKFYPLTEREFFAVSAELNDAEFKLWTYLMVKNPFADKQLEIDTALIAEELGVSRRTIQRRIKRLDEIGLIEIEITRFKYAKKKGFAQKTSNLASEATKVTAGTPDVSPETPELSSSTTTLAQPKPETSTSKGFGIPKTKKTKKTKNTLSEEEREKNKWMKDKNFIAFCKRQADEMPSRVVLLDSWIQSNFEELLSIYKEAAGIGESSAATTPSKNSESTDIHPAIAKGLKDGSLIKYDRHNKMVKIKGEKWWTHVKDYLEKTQESD